MQKPAADFWDSIKTCDDNIVQISQTWVDPYLARNCWMMRGSERSVLIDTGTGTVSLRPIIDAISPLLVIAVACNCFYDHAGGL